MRNGEEKGVCVEVEYQGITVLCLHTYIRKYTHTYACTYVRMYILVYVY